MTRHYYRAKERPLTDYVMFGRPAYAAEPGKFEISISRKGVWCIVDVTRAEAAEMLDDIRRHLELDPGRSMQWGDLGLTDPDDIAF
jgi:hypothetical protein